MSETLMGRPIVYVDIPVQRPDVIYGATELENGKTWALRAQYSGIIGVSEGRLWLESKLGRELANVRR